MTGDFDVPPPIREYVTALIEGSGDESYGWAAALEDAKRTLAAHDRKLKLHPRDGDPSVRQQLSREVLVQRQFVEAVQRNIDTLRLLVTDERMKDAYVFLNPEFTEAWQWKDFAAAAWVAAMDYKKYRERLRDVREHSERIAAEAVKLADLLDTSLGISWPSSFADVATLLKHTDNHDMDNHNLAMWQSMRWHILGYRSSPEASSQIGKAQNKGPVRVKRRFVGPEDVNKQNPLEGFLAELRYAWGVSPSFSALLRTLAREALAFEPSEIGVVAAAIEKRQHNVKNEYIRAFAHVLKERNIAVSANVQRALAVTATVVLNDPALDVSYEDVRKALSG